MSVVYGFYKKEDVTLHREELWGCYIYDDQRHIVIAEHTFYLDKGRFPQDYQFLYEVANRYGRESIVTISLQNYKELHELRQHYEKINYTP